MRRLLVMVILVVGCARTGMDMQPTGQAAAGPTPPQSRRLTLGEALYIRHCADCHSWEGRGDGPVANLFKVKAPSLRRPEIFAQASEADLMARILYGKALEVSFDTATLALTEADVAALMVHLQRLPDIRRERVSQGQQLYDMLCVHCHGIYGRGDGLLTPQLPTPPRDLTSPAWQRQISDAELLAVITDGKGVMPGSGDIMSAAQLQDVLAFVRLLSPGFELYDRFCATCHGADGHPPARTMEETEDETLAEEMPTVVFNSAYFRVRSEGQVRGWVQHMVQRSRALMPHFAGEISRDDVRHILSYLKTLQ
jgi:mono/diheme cytochrome c family protein